MSKEDDESLDDAGAALAAELEEILKRHALQLVEHFDSVQIIATKRHQAGTLIVPRGEGNWYARYGSVRDWVLRQEEDSRCGVRRNNEEGA